MEIPRHWRLKKQRYCLIGEIDKEGRVAFPPGSNILFDPKTGKPVTRVENISRLPEAIPCPARREDSLIVS